MIKSPIGQLNLDAMTNAFKDLELQLDADVLVFFGEIVDGIEANIKQIVEQVCSDEQKHDKLCILLTTLGGSLTPVKRMANIFRHFYTVAAKKSGPEKYLFFDLLLQK